MKEERSEINLVHVNFLKNSYSRLSEGEKNALSDPCIDFLHFLESFVEYENQGLIHFRMLEDLIEDLNTDTCGYIQTFFYENLFFPNSDNVLQNCRRITYDVIQIFLQELFTTNTDRNEKITVQEGKKQ